MPMNPEHYGGRKVWDAISLRIRRDRAGWRCEWPGCTRRQGDAIPGRKGPVVLTVAHLNHDTRDHRDENLMALCQMHHLRYDARHHAKNAAATRRRRRMESGQEALFADESEPQSA